MKKFISIALVLCMLLCLVPAAFANCNLDDKTLSFNADGKFKIMVINDVQDYDGIDSRTTELLRAGLAKEKPDLVVLNGDQIADFKVDVGNKKFIKTIRAICDVIEESRTPFMFTYGNHDAEKAISFPLKEQAKVYNSYRYCVAEDNGTDSGTYNKVIMSSDGSRMAMNIYMFNTGAWDPEGWLCGTTLCQIDWYKNTSDKLTAANGGTPVPSIVFQHVPVKETYDVLKEVDPRTPGAIRGTFFGTAYKGYVLDPERLLPDQDAVLKSTVCSEHPLKYTGEYKAWVEKGDIFAAIFAHDHKNNFLAMSDEGIVMGYNRAAGFGTEGDAGKRGSLILVFDENDIENFEHYNVTYDDLFPQDPVEQDETTIGFILTDWINSLRAKIADIFFWFLYPKAS